jgi:hypothetical protein
MGGIGRMLARCIVEEMDNPFIAIIRAVKRYKIEMHAFKCFGDFYI